MIHPNSRMKVRIIFSCQRRGVASACGDTCSSVLNHTQRKIHQQKTQPNKRLRVSKKANYRCATKSPACATPRLIREGGALDAGAATEPVVERGDSNAEGWLAVGLRGDPIAPLAGVEGSSRRTRYGCCHDATILHASSALLPRSISSNCGMCESRSVSARAPCD
jgi:hypothetical protein